MNFGHVSIARPLYAHDPIGVDVTGRENYRLHSQIVFPVATGDRGEGHIAMMKNLERPSGGLRVHWPKASAPKLHQRNLSRLRRRERRSQRDFSHYRPGRLS